MSTKLKIIPGARFFRCPSCRHALRFGARQCGRCYDSTPIYNRRSTYLVFLGASLLVILSILGMG